jgi:hypothetical protein
MEITKTLKRDHLNCEALAKLIRGRQKTGHIMVLHREKLLPVHTVPSPKSKTPKKNGETLARLIKGRKTYKMLLLG